MYLHPIKICRVDCRDVQILQILATSNRISREYSRPANPEMIGIAPSRQLTHQIS